MSTEALTASTAGGPQFGLKDFVAAIVVGLAWIGTSFYLGCVRQQEPFYSFFYPGEAKTAGGACCLARFVDNARLRLSAISKRCSRHSSEAAGL